MATASDISGKSGVGQTLSSLRSAQSDPRSPGMRGNETHPEVPPVINGIAASANRFTPAILFAATITVGAIAALVYFFLDPTKVAIFPPCLFHQLTGLDCPGCGAQRALHQLLHGHLIVAIRLNAMFVVSLPLFAWVGFRFLARTLRHKPVHLASRWWSLYLAAWIVFGVLRNLPFPVCQWFAA